MSPRAGRGSEESLAGMSSGWVQIANAGQPTLVAPFAAVIESVTWQASEGLKAIWGSCAHMLKS